jgi:hypothetical protein
MRIVRAAAFILFTVTIVARADEGMWLPDRPPVELLKQRYGFEPTKEWLEHVRRSAVHVGASGSFVSRDGLVLTNHHVASWWINKLSTPQRNLMRTGFYASTREQELKCPEAEITVLVSIEDATSAVTQGTENLAPAEQFKERRKRILTIEKESEERTKLNSEVVTLYGGGKYHLYRSQRYTDVRLVFAPELSVAFFGGDVDNFEYPRFDHDFALVRVYDDKTGQPVHPEHFLKWSRTGASDGELLFVVGHPGRTERLHTLDHVLYDRDRALPMQLSSLWRREVQLHSFIDRGGDNPRQAQGDMFGVQNSRKAKTGMFAALLDPQFLAAKADAERQLRAAVDANATYKAQWGDAWDRLTDARKKLREFDVRRDAFYQLTRYSELGSMGQTIVRLTAELQKPNGDRLPEFGDASLDSTLLELYSPAPIDDDIEVSRLASYLSYAAERLGSDDPVVEKLLDGRSPSVRAAEIVRGTKLKDPAERKRLVDGGVAAVEASTDPAIVLMRTLDPETRAIRKRYEDEVEAVDRENYARIAAANFAIRGESTYPDATGTLRIAFGTVKGYRDDDGREVPPFTNVG